MFFNQMVFRQENNHRNNQQISYQLLNVPCLFRNDILYLQLLPAKQEVNTPTQLPKTGWEIAADVLCAVGLGVLIGGAVVLTGAVIVELLRPRRNSVPLTAGIRRYIRERDEEICFYCDDYAPDGHVDHRISRNNGGSNKPENLTWACVFCNCSKGALNDTEYIALLQECY